VRVIFDGRSPVGWEVTFAPRCERDLAEIVSYIAKDDPAAAIRFDDTLITSGVARRCS
jgi:plasmid stabilization system protein ParE